MSNKYNHAEAFCLMQYKCEKCGRVEVLWNSRDGVTPFIIYCSGENCNGEMSHINWDNDVRVVDYKPHKGQRIFANITDLSKEEIEKRKEHLLSVLNNDSGYDVIPLEEKICKINNMFDESICKDKPFIKIVE